MFYKKSINWSYNVDSSGCALCIEESNCKIFVNRKEFINKCVPLVNMISSKINILNFDQTYYIYYDENNKETYYLGKDFKLKNPTIEKLPTYHNINLNSFLLRIISSQLIIPDSKIKIPIYYTFVNTNNSIFNLFTCEYNLMVEQDLEKSKKILKYKNIISNNDKRLISSIMVLDGDKFITLSYKFNIFNVSLLCNKFFDIFPLFIELEDEYDEYSSGDNISGDNNLSEKNKEVNKKKNHDEIILKLKKIFEGFDLLNLYTTINNYKFPINNLSKKNEYNIFMEGQKPKQNIGLETKYANEFDQITKIENSDILTEKEIMEKEKKRNDIYKDLANSIILLKKIISRVQENIVDFDKLFMMSILSYRSKEKTLNNTWSYDTNYMWEYVNCNKKIEFINDSTMLAQIYTIDKPIIYEYSMVNYKNVSYGNCMESTILQFLKVLFYDMKEDKYSTSTICKIIKSDFTDIIKIIFDNISNEKTENFDLEWVEFITELPKSQKLSYGDYDFIRKEEQVEINATLANLILALKYLITDKINKNLEPNIFLNEIFSRVKPIYHTNISLFLNKEIINIYCYKKYTIELKHFTHANFQNSKLNKNSEQINILQNYSYHKNINKYLFDNIKITYSDITSLIALDYIYTNIKLYKKYLNLFSPNIISDAYKLLFHDDVRKKIDFNILFININIFNYWNDDLWKLLIDNFNKNNTNNYKFWNKFGDLNIFDNWNIEVWKYAIVYLSDFKNFWSKTINYTSCCKWNNYIWSHVFVWADSSETIFKAYKLGCYSGWDNETWDLIIELCDLDEFYVDIFENNIYLSWDSIIWNTFIIQKNTNDLLWKVIIDKQIYLVWTCKVWNMAFENLENKFFWENIDFNKIMYVFKDEIFINEIKKNKKNIFNKICKEMNSDYKSDNGYYLKYLKYKNKYFRLKNEFSK